MFENNTSSKAIVILNTAWGSRHGGINSFSTDLCRGLSSIIDGHTIVCVCPNIEPEDEFDAKKIGINLLSLNRENSTGYQADDIERIHLLLKSRSYLTISWWIGHDVITGPLAVECSKNWSGSKSAVFMHTSYPDYAYIKHSGTERAEQIDNKISEQQQALKRAHIGFGVGPLLHERLLALRGKDKISCMLIPGLWDNIEERTQSRSIQISMAGRLDADEDFIKQAPLAVKAFATACKAGTEMNHPAFDGAKMRLIGVPKANAISLRNLANKTAGRAINLEIHDFVADQSKIRKWFRQSNLCLMPSWHEGFGLTAWEAVAAETPLIVSRNSGFFQFLEHHGGSFTGCIKSEDIKGSGDGRPNPIDVESLKTAILQVSQDLPGAEKNAFQLRQKLRFEENYTWFRTALEFCQALDLPYRATILDSAYPPLALREERYLALGVEVPAAKGLFETIKGNHKCGYYLQALEGLNNLKNYRGLSSDSGLLLDALIIEADTYLRMGEYVKSTALSERAANEASARMDNKRYVQASLIKCITMMDQGFYSSAIQIAEGLMSSHVPLEPTVLNSISKTLARARVLNGDFEQAREMVARLELMAHHADDPIGKAKMEFTIGEIYRHLGEYRVAREHYKIGIDFSQAGGHVDCFLWSILGDSDCQIFLGDFEEAQTRLVKIKEFLNDGSSKFDLESLHVNLLLLEIKFFLGENVNESISELALNYSKFGIQWPSTYFANLVATKKPNPKRF